MNYKKLGNTDIEVSTISLGTMTWGEQNSEAEGFEQMDYALDQGINFLTQPRYILYHQKKKLLATLKKLLEIGLRKQKIEIK